MSIKDKEYSCSSNEFNITKSLKGNDAIGARLMELIMMEPGDDPLHPDMGVGLHTFRYGINNLSDLKNRVQKQIETYLPFYQNVDVTIIQTPDKVCNIEISIGNTVYIYDSNNASKPITLSDIT
jgi:hypothetical protein